MTIPMKKTIYGLLLATLACQCFGQVNAVRVRFSAGATTTSTNGGGGGGSSLTNNMVAFWAMTNTGSAAEPDLVSGANSLTVSASDTIANVAIVQGMGRDFETAEDDYMYGVSNSIIDFSSDTSFTVACWATLESASTFKPLVRKPGSFSTSLSSANIVQFSVSSASTNRILLGPNLGVGTNYLLAFVHDATNDTLSITVFDGVGMRYASQAYTEGTTNTGSQVWISGVETDTTQNWDGLIGGIGVWHRALSTNEVSSIFNSGSGVAWPFTGL